MRKLKTKEDKIRQSLFYEAKKAWFKGYYKLIPPKKLANKQGRD